MYSLNHNTYSSMRKHIYRVVNIKESQPVENRNLSRLIANLSRQIWSSERTVFIVFQQCLLFYNSKKYLSTS
jgi:hypothetical protein